MDPQAKGKRILVVEDETPLRDLYVEILKEQGYEVDSASEGETALSKMKAGGYNLVLLDLIMPKMDGLEVLEKLKADPSIIPNKSIVILTNVGHDGAIAKGVGLGATGYLVKMDYTPDKLLEEIKNYIK
ncbi:MAG: response regulator [Candidatus Roizmanbacteria bacterium]